MSHRLKQRGLPHLVLERHRIAERWRSERWDGLASSFRTGRCGCRTFAFPHDDPDGFSASSEILDFIDGLCRVRRAADPLRRRGDGAAARRRRRFIAETSDGAIEADNVVVATGPYQRAVIPALREGIELFQVHASRYANPEQLPAGAVLVVGAGASGAQIAEELLRAGRRVFLSVGRHTRLPRRYRGRDLIWWLATLGIDETPVELRGPSRLLPVISGAHGGDTIDFRRFAADGMTLAGTDRVRRMTACSKSRLISPTASPIGDAAYAEFLDFADAHVAAAKPRLAARSRRPARSGRIRPA